MPVPSDGALLVTASGFGGINAALVLALSALPGTPAAAGDIPPSTGGERNRARHPARIGAGTQRAIAAVRRALDEAGRGSGESGAPRGAARIGIIAHDRDGCTAANRAYFTDYVASGRALGRGQLFAATLPTSVAAECAIALGLRGPLLAVAEPDGGDGAARRAAAGLLAEGLADAMVLLEADGTRAAARVVVTAEEQRPAASGRAAPPDRELPAPESSVTKAPA